MDNEIVGERIKRLRLDKRMTREELAEAADLSVSFLYEIETGKKSFSAYTLKNLAKALDVKMEYIVQSKEENVVVHSLRQGTELTVENLLSVQKLLMNAYREIQELIDG